MLKYCLVDNRLAKDEKNFVAMVSSPVTMTLDKLIDEMISEGTGLTRPQALAYFEKLMQATISFLDKGYCVSTPFFVARPTIKGVFNSAKEQFDPEKHQINISFRSGKKLQKSAAAFYLEKVDLNIYQPILYDYFDAATLTKNSIAIPGGIGTLEGKHLFFDREDLSLGVFFIPVNNPEVNIRAMIYSRLFPSELSFVIPSLEPGEYRVMVKTTYKNKDLNCYLPVNLTV